MSTLLIPKALNKLTHECINVNNANKEDPYIRSGCKKDVIFKKGNIRCPHFAHKSSNNPCEYYNTQNESQIHKRC